MPNHFRSDPLIEGFSPIAWLNSLVFWNSIVPDTKPVGVEPEALSYETILVIAKDVAKKNSWMSSRFSEVDRCQLALEAILLNIHFHPEYLAKKARDRDKTAFRIADNFLKNQFKREFPKELSGMPEWMDEDGHVYADANIFGASGSKFELPTSPNQYSRYRSQEVMNQMAEWLRANLTEAVKQLPDAQRQIIQLLFYGDTETTCSDVAQKLGLPLSTVYFRLAKAIKKLRELLGTNDA